MKWVPEPSRGIFDLRYLNNTLQMRKLVSYFFPKKPLPKIGFPAGFLFRFLCSSHCFIILLPTTEAKYYMAPLLTRPHVSIEILLNN